MLFQAELEFTGIGIAISIIIFPIGIYVMRWYANKKDMPPTKVWDTSLKTAFIVNLIWLIIDIPISILFNFLFAQNMILYLLIQYYNYIVINIFIGIVVIRKVYKKELEESFRFVLVIQLILFGIGLILAFVIALILGYISPDISYFFFFILREGLPQTLLLTAQGLFWGFVLGISLAIMRVYGGKELVWLASGYEKIFRGIPLLVLIFILILGAPDLFCLINIITGERICLDPLDKKLASIVLALALRSGAYQSQIFRGAILSVNPGQMEAAYALGMNRLQTFRHIIMPQALRLALPSWSNEYAIVIKDSSFAYIVGVIEMTRASFIVTKSYPQLFALALVIAAILYFLVTYPLTKYFGERQTKKLKKLGMGGG